MVTSVKSFVKGRQAPSVMGAFKSNKNMKEKFEHLDERFTQVGDMLWIDGSVWFYMPDYFNLNDVSRDLKAFALMLLYDPREPERYNYPFNRA